MTEHNKYKFVFAVISLFLLPFMIVSGQFISGSKTLRKNDMLRYFEMRTLAGARIISNELNTNYNLARITEDNKFLESGEAGRKKILEQRIKEQPFIYSELALLTASGREICRVSDGKGRKPAVNYAKSQVFEQAKKTAVPAGAVEYGEYTPPALILAGPVAAAGGGTSSGGERSVCYLAGHLSLAYLGEVVRLMGKNSAGNFGLLDGGGQIIADSMNMSIVKPGVQAPPEILKLLAVAQEKDVQNFAREIILKDGPGLVSVSNVPGTRWWVYEIMDAAGIPAYKGAARAWRVVFLSFLLIICFGFASYHLAVRWLVRGRADGGTHF